MIKIRMPDEVFFYAYTDRIDEFTEKVRQALKRNMPIELERPKDKHLRFLNPRQIIYYELTDSDREE